MNPNLARASDEATQKHQDMPAPMGEEVYYGLIDEVVAAILPFSEADAHTLIVTFLVLFGNRVGNGVRYQYAPGAEHHTNENLVVVGTTGEGRKSTGMKNIIGLWSKVEDGFSSCPNYCSGLSSGEGLISAVRDPHTAPGKEADPGVTDKRLFVRLDEFGSLFNAMSRENNNLGQYLRQAFDGDTLQSLIKSAPQQATNPHISLAGCITPDELKAVMHERKNKTRSADGFINRFLWVAAKRSKKKPYLEQEELHAMVEAIEEVAGKVKASLVWAREKDRILEWDAAAKGAWTAFYDVCQAPAGTEGLIGRAEAHVCRLAMVYALLDKSETMQVHHLKAAAEVYRYCRESAIAIFLGPKEMKNYTAGQFVNSSSSSQFVSSSGVDEEKVMKYVQAKNKAKRTDISKEVFQRNKTKADLDKILSSLLDKELITSLTDTATKPPTTWYFPSSSTAQTNCTNCDELTNCTQTGIDEEYSQFDKDLLATAGSGMNQPPGPIQDPPEIPF
jgi:hypothetical protein